MTQYIAKRRILSFILGNFSCILNILVFPGFVHFITIAVIDSQKSTMYMYCIVRMSIQYVLTENNNKTTILLGIRTLYFRVRYL